MNNYSTRFPAIALAAGVALSMLFVPPARAADCANPQGTGMARACEKAATSTTELRRFVERTQPIYHLSVYDFRAAESYASASRETLGDEYAKLAVVAKK
ncbi:MAG: hypothetical protein ABI881_05135 [Betaproteobacteria bacterium]